MAALRAIDSIEEAEAKAKNNRDSSCTKSFPTLPAGTLKLFSLQCTTSEYVASSAWEKSSALWTPQENTGVLMGWKCGSCCGHGGHEIESGCSAEIPGAPVTPFPLRALSEPREEAERRPEAGVRAEGSVVFAADGFTVVVFGVDVEETLEQLPSLLGRQLEHFLPAFTQAQPLHEPVLLHLQHDTITSDTH